MKIRHDKVEIMQFDHVGLLTSDADSAAKTLSLMGYSIGNQLLDPLQKVFVRMAKSFCGKSKIEIIKPTDCNLPLNSLLRRRNDYMYHSCFRVSKTALIKEQLILSGVQITTLSEPKPAILFNQRLVSFHLIEGLGLVEFIECD